MRILLETPVTKASGDGPNGSLSGVARLVVSIYDADEPVLRRDGKPVQVANTVAEWLNSFSGDELKLGPPQELKGPGVYTIPRATLELLPRDSRIYVEWRLDIGAGL